MRALHVFPAFPGASDEGAAVFSTRLTKSLAEAGVEVEVLASRATRLEMRRLFQIEWPPTMPAAGRVGEVPVARFGCTSLPSAAGALADRAVLRHWRRRKTAMLRASVDPRSPEALFAEARRWPRHLDLAAQLGRGPLTPGLLRRLRRDARRFDVVLVGHAPFGLLRWVQLAARGSGTPVLLLPFLHEQDPFHHLPSLHAAYRSAAAVLTLSSHTTELLRRHLPGSRPLTIGAGVDLDLFDSDSVSGERFRRRHGLAGRRIVLFVGRKEAGKRYEIALRVAAGLPDDCLLAMVGRDIDRRPLPPGVLHLDGIDRAELADAYAASELLLHPSDQESFGMVCLESWARRRPVIANARCGASAALVDAGRDGLLLEPDADWAAATRELLGDPARAREMGEAGRKKVLGEFTWGRVAARALRGYHLALAGSSPSAPAPSLDAE